MAYNPNQPFTYGIHDGSYVGKPTTASCFEKDGRLILDVKFAVMDQRTGEWLKNDRGYEFEANKRHWLTSKDGGFNEATIKGLKEWAKGWDPKAFADFWWFQSPDANGVPFGNLAAVGEVELNFTTDANGSQSLFVHDPNRQRGRRAFVPEGANTDAAALAAKWGAKAKALFASTPRAVSAQTATAPAQTAPAHAQTNAPAAPARPSRPAAAPAPAQTQTEDAQTDGEKPWAAFPQTADGAFAYFSSLLGEPYQSAKHDGRWFDIFDAAANGKDPDEFGEEDVQRLFAAVRDEMAKPF